MSKVNHTHGPWESILDTDGSILIKTKSTSTFRQIAVIPSDVRITDFDWANAHLIAAAPAMLEALELALSLLTDPNAEAYQADQIIKEINVVINKARGES